MHVMLNMLSNLDAVGYVNIKLFHNGSGNYFVTAIIHTLDHVLLYVCYPFIGFVVIKVTCIPIKQMA